MLSPEGVFFRRKQKEICVMKNNNQINVPQTRGTMDKFKMLIKLPKSVLTCRAVTTPH